MRILAALTFLTLSFSAFSQTCFVDMIDRYNRVVRSFPGIMAQGSCYEGLKECRKSIRMDSHLGGVDCVNRAYQQPTPPPRPNTDLISRAMNREIRGCEVVVESIFYQLYVNGSFKGNYRRGQQDYELMQIIQSNINNGRCTDGYYQDTRIMNDPYLIRDFETGVYRNCFVRVEGSFYQVYVNGSFKGNYSMYSDEMRLRATLADKIISGTCYR